MLSFQAPLRHSYPSIQAMLLGRHVFLNAPLMNVRPRLPHNASCNMCICVKLCVCAEANLALRFTCATSESFRCPCCSSWIFSLTPHALSGTAACSCSALMSLLLPNHSILLLSVNSNMHTSALILRRRGKIQRGGGLPLPPQAVLPFYHTVPPALLSSRQTSLMLEPAHTHLVQNCGMYNGSSAKLCALATCMLACHWLCSL